MPGNCNPYEQNNERQKSTLVSGCRILLWWGVVLAGSLASPAQVGMEGGTLTGTRNAAEFPGASIVERVQAAIRDCGLKPCEVYIPAGSYNSSPISSWKNRDVTGTRVGIAVPSNVEIRGAGIGHTILHVVRSGSDPTGTLLANAIESGRNIHIHDMTITWIDSSSSYDWVSIFICHGCERLELDHLSLEGNPNKLVNLLDSTASSVHDNTFVLHSTGYGHGDNALSFSRFDPALSVGGEAGVARDNHFRQSGDYRTFSMLIVAQSGLYVHSNVFEAHLPPPGNATGIESGQDNLARLPENIKISGNIFHGASIAYGGASNSEISGNFLDHGDIYVALQSGTTASLSGLTIADNELHFGSIAMAGLEHVFTGRSLITRNRVFDGGIGTGNSLVAGDIEVSYNEVRYTKDRSGIECNACSVMRGNLVREVGQGGPADHHAGYVIGGAVVDVSDNLYIDEQHEYDAGTVCSVANPSSRTCLSSGKSRWIWVRGGEWGFGWTNRVLLTDRGNLFIRAFVTSSLLELDDEADALPAGTHYHLSRTTSHAFELNSAVIERFANNVAIATTGSFRNATVQESGTVRIRSLSGNVFRPYSCLGKCAVDYRSNISASE
ncbi:MAG: hypothetical protein WCC87_26475 [Candidatus Korobacteraceae bacterium]